jgi:serine/threonine protein kinase
LKLENVLVEYRGLEVVNKCLIADLGISCTIDTSAPATITREFAGTPGYLAPEAALGRYDPLKADVYALGVVALALICGCGPTFLPEATQPAAVPFSLSEKGSARIDEDEDLAWVEEQVYRKCSALKRELRPEAGELLALITDQLTTWE